MDEQELSALIGRIYGVVAEPDRCERVMAAVMEATGSHFMLTAAMRHGRVESRAPRFHGDFTGRMLDGVAEYEAETHGIDPTFDFVAANPTAGLFATDRHMTRDEHAAHPFVRWTRHHFGNQHWSLRYMLRDGLHFGASLHPKDRHDPHTAEQRRLFDLLFDHMACAQRIAARPPDLSARRDACLVVDGSGRIEAASPGAERMLASKDGLSVEGGRLTASDRFGAARLAALMALAASLHAGRAGGSLGLSRPSGRRALYVNIEPLPPQAGFGGFARATVRIVDPDEAPEPLAPRLVALWSLTPAEARLADLLVETHCDLRACADRLGVTYGTVRTQLARVFAKSGARSQPELMRLLTRLSG